MKMTPRLSEQANQYLEHLVLTRFIGDRIELLNYRLKEQGYQDDLVNEINELIRIRSENDVID